MDFYLEPNYNATGKVVSMSIKGNKLDFEANKQPDQNELHLDYIARLFVHASINQGLPSTELA